MNQGPPCLGTEMEVQYHFHRVKSTINPCLQSNESINRNILTFCMSKLLLNTVLSYGLLTWTFRVLN